MNRGIEISLKSSTERSERSGSLSQLSPMKDESFLGPGPGGREEGARLAHSQPGLDAPSTPKVPLSPAGGAGGCP